MRKCHKIIHSFGHTMFVLYKRHFVIIVASIVLIHIRYISSIVYTPSSLVVNFGSLFIRINFAYFKGFNESKHTSYRWIH